ncbi:MAG: hypothetical protein KTR31_36790 [Myxococcales bacterium]|nr:hypothetical protein [Myxococcales bacterium]
MVMAPQDATSRSRTLALELRGLLRDLDPVRWRAATEAALVPRLRALHDKVASWLEATEGNPGRVREHWVEMCDLLGRQPPAPDRDAWLELRDEAEPVYEALAQAVRASTGRPLPSLRPTNHVRSVVHLFNAFGVIALVHWVLTTQTLMVAASTAALLGAWGMELARRRSAAVNRVLMRFFSPVAHPHEAHRINSATWYVTAVFLMSLTVPVDVGFAALAVLGMGDPAAALVGRRYGRTPLLHGRTLEGSLAFVVVGGAAAFAVLTLVSAAPWWILALRALAAAVAGATAEVLARRIDDNLAIPLGASAAGILVRALGG